MDKKQTPSKRSGIKWDHIVIWILAIALTVGAIYGVLKLIPNDELDYDVDKLLEEPTTIIVETEPPAPPEPETVKMVNFVPWPDVDEQLLTVNEWSRPGKKTKSIDKVVIHYLGNPKTTAQENHDYFESLKDLQNTSMSANFVIGINGEIIECVPPGEVAYASNDMNSYSVSIENCHLDSSGRFTEETYASLIKMTAWVVVQYDLGRDDIIRHYDVTGKECPVYYVENPDKWESFKDDVMNYIEECRAASR